MIVYGFATKGEEGYKHIEGITKRFDEIREWLLREMRWGDIAYLELKIRIEKTEDED